MRKYLVSALAGILLAAPSAVQAQVQENSAQLSAPTISDLEQRLYQVDQMVLGRMSSLNIPGYTLAIIKNGKVVFQKPYGFADLASKQPVTNETVFGLASLTKTFTALALLSLVDKGLVNLDDPLAKYVDKLTPQYRNLTLRQLASMTAGVPSKVPQEVDWKNQLSILDRMPLAFEPGTKSLYSNFSYRLLGSVITNVTGKDYMQYIYETILNPLQMSSTATTVLLERSGRVARAYGDNQGSGPLQNVEYKNPEVSFSAGMLASTSDDLVRYVLGLLSQQIISKQSYQTLWYQRPPLTTGQPCKWAFGWAAGPNPKFNGQYVLSMNGGTPGVASSIMIFPETNSAVIALCNLRKPPVYSIAKMAARLMFGSSEQTASPEQKDDQPDSGAAE